MTKRFLQVILASLLATPASASLFLDPVDVFQIGNTFPVPVTLSWNHFYDGLGTATFATLTIVAEGVDEDPTDPVFREDDEVFLNGTSLGLLDDQNFFFIGFDINPGPGALGFPRTELSTTSFNINLSLLLAGNNLIEVVVDPDFWIMEVETSLLRVERIDPTPEASTLLLIGLGFLGLAASRKRN